MKVRVRILGIAATCVLASWSAMATEYPSPTHRYMQDTVQLCDIGSFFVGGALKTTNYGTSTPSAVPNTVVVGQMYVSFTIPSKYDAYPVIMISGGGHTGAALESTPMGERLGDPMRYGMAFPLSSSTNRDAAAPVLTRLPSMRARPGSSPEISVAQI